MILSCVTVVVLSSLVAVASSSSELWTTPSKSCPPWTTPSTNPRDNSSQCVCGDDLSGIVHCNRDTLEVSVLICYCMTYNRKTNRTLIGHCQVMCTFMDRQDCSTHNKLHTRKPDAINREICGILNRTGQLCGECAGEGYAPPAYSYTLACVKCEKSHFAFNLLKYIAVAFLPLTIFFVLAIIFKVKVASGPMVVYVLTCQLLAVPFILRNLAMPQLREPLGMKVLIAYFALWNLDIFRSVYTPFCIHPDMTTLQVLALDYLVGVYPLVLIVLTYIAVLLHDRYPLVVRLWRPVYRLFMCLRREWDIRGSLIQAFATFLVLSYVKILNVSFDLLTPAFLLTVDGGHDENTYLYNAGEVLYFRSEHLPYAILALLMLTVFGILPIILLLLYPCSCFRRCLSFCRLNIPALHIFMDTFQGSYRHKPRDCRYFAALYLIVRFLQPLMFMLVRDMTCLLLSCLYMILLALAVVIFKPYKENSQNVMDAAVFLLNAFCFLLTIANQLKTVLEPRQPVEVLYYVLVSPLVVIFILYGFWVAVKTLLPLRVLNWLGSCVRVVFKRRRMCAHTEEVSEVSAAFPHRLEHENEYVSLSQ